jgi:hypothetical protein
LSNFVREEQNWIPAFAGMTLRLFFLEKLTPEAAIAEW